MTDSQVDFAYMLEGEFSTDDWEHVLFGGEINEINMFSDDKSQHTLYQRYSHQIWSRICNAASDFGVTAMIYVQNYAENRRDAVHSLEDFEYYMLSIAVMECATEKMRRFETYEREQELLKNLRDMTGEE